MAMFNSDQPTPTADPSPPQNHSHWRRWIMAIAGIAVFAGGLIYHFYVPHPRHAEIRLPRTEEYVPLERFHQNGSRNPRSIATITSCFTRSTWLTIELFAVEDGDVTLVGGQDSGRSSTLSRPDDPYLMTLRVTFALADAETVEGHTTLMAMRGATRSHGGGGGIHEPFKAAVTRTFTGRIDPGEERLLYVEGDRAFTASPRMTPEQFAATNSSGRFLVAMLRFAR